MPTDAGMYPLNLESNLRLQCSTTPTHALPMPMRILTILVFCVQLSLALVSVSYADLFFQVIHNDGFDVFVFRRKLFSFEQGVLFVFCNRNLHNPDVPTLSTSVESEPEVHQRLSDQHADCTGHQPTNDTENSGNDEEAESLAENVSEAMHLVRSMMGIGRTTTNVWILTVSATLLAPASTLDPSTSSMGAGLGSLKNSADAGNNDGMKTAD